MSEEVLSGKERKMTDNEREQELVRSRVLELWQLRKVAEQAECLLIHQSRYWSDAAKHSAKLLAEALRKWKDRDGS